MQTAPDADSVHTPTFNDKKLYLVTRIAEDLAPNLADCPNDRGMACQMAWRLVRSYKPTSEDEVLNAARIASLSLTQLEVLRAAAGANLTAALKLKLIGSAVALNRSITQAERALARSQRSEEVRRPKLPIPDRPETPVSDNAHHADIADLAMRRARLRDEVARLEARAAKATQTAKPPTTAPAEPAPPPLSRPVANPVEPPPEPKAAARTVRSGCDAVADFRRHVAAAYPSHCATRQAGANRAAPRTDLPPPPPPA